MAKKHLVINQNTGVTENVSQECVNKLYAISYENVGASIDGQIDSNSDVRGNIRVPVAYEDRLQYLRTKFPNLTITADSVYVSFRDPNVEAACIAAFSTDGVGVTDADAARVTQLPVDFLKDNRSVVDFSDLGTIFYNCTQIGTRAFQNSSIKYVDLSKIVTINLFAFRDSDLEGDLNTPRLLGTLGQAAFKGTKITSISDLGNITKIEGRVGYSVSVFGSCTSLTSVVLPATLTTIIDAFNGCSSLTSITGLEIIETLRDRFNFNGLADKVLNFAQLTKLYIDNFMQGSFGQIYLKNITTGENSKTGSYCTGHTYSEGILTKCTAGLVYLKDIVSLYPGDVSNATITALVINNTTVPSLKNRNDAADADATYLWNTVFTYFTGVIYVPDSALNDYQTDAKWSTLGLTIRGMSELSRYATYEAWVAAGKPVALIEEYM